MAVGGAGHAGVDGCDVRVAVAGEQPEVTAGPLRARPTWSPAAGGQEPPTEELTGWLAVRQWDMGGLGPG
ncbi:hypothetical protein ACSDR0_36000 [Streptosporangium sp. G11]|uniref:hypothetical protein n=1 Tax=Streptosporangium sp. G11 TaxID=3436926 RepID=UPI003EBBADC0